MKKPRTYQVVYAGMALELNKDEYDELQRVSREPESIKAWVRRHLTQHHDPRRANG